MVYAGAAGATDIQTQLLRAGSPDPSARQRVVGSRRKRVPPHAEPAEKGVRHLSIQKLPGEAVLWLEAFFETYNS